MSTSNVAAPSSSLVIAIEDLLERRRLQAEELARRARVLATARTPRNPRTWTETKRELLGPRE